MKIYCIIYLFLSFCCTARGQINLVLNPSFEDSVFCPNAHGQIHGAQFWSTPTIASPDYFSACASFIPWPLPCVSVPQNTSGYQFARTGNCYAGLITYQLSIPDGREYITNQLAESLVQGEKYYVEFYVSLADSLELYSSSIGAYFSSDTFFVNSYLSLSFVPQVQNPITNSLNSYTSWRRVFGTFIANGGEKYMTIGNFFNNADSDTTYNSPQWTGMCYYYIDDVSVYLCPDTLLPEEPNSATFNIYPNPNNGEFIIDYGLPLNSNGNFVLYNMIGQKIYEQNLQSGVFVNQKINIPTLASGAYSWRFIADGAIVKNETLLIMK